MTPAITIATVTYSNVSHQSRDDFTSAIDILKRRHHHQLIVAALLTSHFSLWLAP
jgi:hypothetical protein